MIRMEQMLSSVEERQTSCTRAGVDYIRPHVFHYLKFEIRIRMVLTLSETNNQRRVNCSNLEREKNYLSSSKSPYKSDSTRFSSCTAISFPVSATMETFNEFGRAKSDFQIGLLSITGIFSALGHCNYVEYDVLGCFNAILRL